MNLCVLLILVLVVPCTAGSAAAAPNVLLVIADDLTCRDIGCYGNTEVQTPNIDRLASQGMRFSRSFTATAMCAPTRQQLYTGIFPVRNGAYPNHSRVKPGTKSIVHHLGDLGYRVGLSGKTHFGPPESFPFEKVGHDAVAEFIGRDKQQPFCLVYASHSPHLPWSKGDPSVYDADKLVLPPYLADTPETRRARTRYYAEVTDLDREVGECMRLVRKAGVERDTIFIFTSEQGAQFPHGKWTCYDTGLHTALVIRWPGRVKPDSVAEAMVQYVDVVPTLVDAAGGKPIEGLDGRSFLPVLLGQTDEHHDAVFGVHTTKGIIAGTPEGYPIRSIRTAAHKYIMNLNHEVPFHNVLIAKDGEKYWQSWVESAATDPHAAKLVEWYQRRPAEELYDIVDDPYELNNLADDPGNRALMDSLRKRLEAWMQQQGDKGLETELGYRKAPKRNKAKKR
jgi:uncharacterized sulfatase